MSGCNEFIPSVPDDEYDEENAELAYMKVVPAQAEMKINQSKVFELKAYNSDNKLIAMDITKFEKWIVMYYCVNCGVVWNISPSTGSFKTTFTPYKDGKYTISAKYDGKWAKSVVYAN